MAVLDITRTATNRPNNQTGAALMVMLVIFIIGSLALLVSALSRAGAQNERDKVTTNALAQAKEALIGYATNNNIPGQLPCPEQTSLIGTATEGSASGSCSNTVPTIGRLPWRTLGIGPLLDGNGDLLWYVLSPGFHSTPINSDTQAKLTVDGSPNSAVAIIFSAGSPINGQARTTPTNTSPPNVTQYLDLSNNDGNNTFITNGPLATFNDRLIVVTHNDLFQVVEKRVAKELLTTFASYISNNPNNYPNPANINCPTTGNCNFDTAQCRGWIPTVANNNPTWVLPNWFTPNNWQQVIYYSAGSARLSNVPSGCSLLLSSAPAQALFIMAGSKLNSQIRPSSNIQDYLEDMENYNMDDSYVKPGSTSSSNDTLYVLP